MQLHQLGLQQLGASPNRGQLNSFLGLPSDEGFQGLSRNAGNEFNVNRDVVEGPRGGLAAGTTVEGPRGGEAVRGAAVGPDGRAIAGSAVRGPEGYGAGRGAAVGPRGAVAGFTRYTPTGRYMAAAAVRDNFHDYGIYGPAWFRAHPGAWYAAGWAAGSAWEAANWTDVGDFLGYAADLAPVDYDYGNNITVQNNNVVVDGQPETSTALPQYYDQSAALSGAGAKADASPDEQWLSLGVFALTKPGHTDSTIAIQLAVNRQGIIRGTYTDELTSQSLTVAGAVDRKKQRVAFTVGDHKTTVFEMGLYNLTQDEVPVLVQHSNDRNDQWLLVRLKQPPSGDTAQ
jgi:hypothetical protein